jgi:hypothetical protein
LRAFEAAAAHECPLSMALLQADRQPGSAGKNNNPHKGTS